jgi:hypothetical protein
VHCRIERTATGRARQLKPAPEVTAAATSQTADTDPRGKLIFERATSATPAAETAKAANHQLLFERTAGFATTAAAAKTGEAKGIVVGAAHADFLVSTTATAVLG